MMRVGLTKRQRAAFDFIEAEILAERAPPSFDEIQAHLGLRSKSGAHRLVTGLVDRGWLIRKPNHARSLALPGAVRAQDLRLAQAERQSAETGDLTVTIPRALAARLVGYCEVRRRAPTDVIREALDAHLRWPS